MAATVSYRLNRPKPDNKPVAILMRYYRKGLTVEISCGQKVAPDKFTGTRVEKEVVRSAKINKVLSDRENQLLNLEFDHPGVTRQEEERIARAIITGEPVGKPTIEKKTVETWIENFILESKRKKSTKQVYRSSLDHLNDYAAKFNVDLTWNSFTIEFYESFTSYLYSIGHCDNTVGKIIKTIKTFISGAFERNLHTNLSFKKKGFKVISAEVDEIYLNEFEITTFHNADLSKNPELVESKKKFVFDCWVGLRYGDLQKLNPNHEQKTIGHRMLKITTTKTGEDAFIPLHPIAAEIWDSWKGLPPQQNNPSFNKDIKLIAEIAGLNSLVQKRNTIKGVVTIEWVPKFKLVKAHTCRRSFATNSYLMGVPIQTIMAVTGHRTEKAFKKYIRITKETHANIMADFFNNSVDKMRIAN
jgi:integrase